MCGISGIAYKDKLRRIDEDMLARMTDIQRHRGPDSDGLFVGPGVGLGFRRLSIIDLEMGNQPISNEDGSVTIVCNGEIYNYRELQETLVRRGHCLKSLSDVEVIVHLYEEYGTDCLEHLRGMFAFALWDGRKRTLMLARDRFGIKPLYYCSHRGALYFASEIKAILAARKVERVIDPAALSDIFTFGFVRGDRTMIKGIKSLPPANYLIFRDKEPSIHRYWEPALKSPGSLGGKAGEGDLAEGLKEKLEESVRIHLRSDVEIGAFLSPGIDSSAVVSLMARILERPVKSFTITFEDVRTDEVSRNKPLSDFPGFEHENYRVLFKDSDFDLFPKTLWNNEVPFSSGSEVVQMVLSRYASNHVKTVVTGEGADEIFGGYEWYRTNRILEPLSMLPLPLKRLIAGLPPLKGRWPGACRTLLTPPRMNLERYTSLIGPPGAPEYLDQIFSDEIKEDFDGDDRVETSFELPSGFEDLDSHSKLLCHDLKIRLPDTVLHHLDRSSMAYSLEARVPFLDHELFEFCAKIPTSLKLKGFEEKYILRRSMEGLVPGEILKRRKFAMRGPLYRWLLNETPEFASVMLSQESLRDKGYFNPAYVGRLLDRYRSGNSWAIKPLLGVLGVQLFDEFFIRGIKGGLTEPDAGL